MGISNNRAHPCQHQGPSIKLNNRLITPIRRKLAGTGPAGPFNFIRELEDADGDKTHTLPVSALIGIFSRHGLTLTEDEVASLPRSRKKPEHVNYRLLIQALRQSIHSTSHITNALYDHFDQGKDYQIDRRELELSIHTHGEASNQMKGLVKTTLPMRISRRVLDEWMSCFLLGFAVTDEATDLLAECWPSIFSCTTGPAASCHENASADFQSSQSATTLVKPKRDRKLMYKRVPALGERRFKRIGNFERKELEIESCIKILRRTMLGTNVQLTSLIREFKEHDCPKSQHVSIENFRQALLSLFPACDFAVIDAVSAHYNDGPDVNYRKFISDLRGPLKDLRQYSVIQSFRRLDTLGRGYVSIHQLLAAYDQTYHPAWHTGAKTREELFQEELSAGFEGGERMDEITLANYTIYWHNRSVNIPDDDIFCLMAWRTFNPDHHLGVNDIRHEGKDRWMGVGSRMNFLV
ncbi:hypothetical protein BC832DRAFT_542966 [Gaertneriomyces semiglobifer]|nr:hypothetical protein BC832DRAFT_542966 [Gaertneriomyces semiglobifer]